MVRQGRLRALLDFDDAHETFLLADVAVLLDVWDSNRRRGAFKPPQSAGVLRAYSRRRPLTAAEWDLLPDFLALFNLADATSYVMGRIRRGVSADQAVGDCHAYARFHALTASPNWRDRRRSSSSRP